MIHVLSMEVDSYVLLFYYNLHFSMYASFFLKDDLTIIQVV